MTLCFFFVKLTSTYLLARMMSPLGLLLNVSSISLERALLAYYNNTFQLLAPVLVALLYPNICDVNFISILKGGEAQQYQSGKA